MIKALGLLSGGLDSILAARLLLEQSIKVTGISFTTPFFNAEKAKKAAKALKISLIIKDITKEHLKMLLKPKHGYGSGMNPCIDCHILMLKRAGRIMEEKDFDFIFTGEVLGERPMSQNRAALEIVAKESGYREYILRPLSAKLLPETKPEKEGKVDRNKLSDINGRQRKVQLEMARRFNIEDVPTPAGGCLLTDPAFSGRLRDVFHRNGNPTIQDIELLKVGRHVCLDKENKIVIGRNERDNAVIKTIKGEHLSLLIPNGVRGPLCVIPRTLEGPRLKKATKICASYCSAHEGDEITFFISEGVERKRNGIVKTIFSKSNRPKGFIGTQ